MATAAWDDVERVFREALEQAPAERSAFLQRACIGNVALLDEVSSLLSAASPASGYLDGLAKRAGLRQADPEAFAAGAVVGPYTIERPLGRGGMGTVYEAVHGETGARVALKTVLLHDEGLLQRIRREIYGLSRLAHPGIVRIVDQGATQGLPWYAMELLEGVTLRDALREPWSVEATVKLIRQLCAPLGFLHGEGLVHGDLKPSNVLLTGPTRRPVIVDFGLVSEFGAALSRDTMASDPALAGTALYMAPEQLRGELADARADLYSLDCIFFELLTGEPPFAGESTTKLLDASSTARSESPALPTSLAANIPAELNAIALRLLAKEPRARFGYAADVDAALAAFDTSSGPVRPAAARMYLYRANLVGRGDATTTLENLLSRVLTGPGAMAAVGGESGSGKTRLALELARRASTRGMLVLLGEGEQAGSAPLASFDQPLQRLADRCRARGAAETARVLAGGGRILAQYHSGFAALPGIDKLPKDPTLAAEATNRRLFAAVRGALATLAAEKPTLFVIDDVQWVGGLALGCLQFIAENPVPHLLVLATYRSDERTPELDRSLARAGLQLTLGRLGAREVSTMVSDMLALDNPPAELVRAVARHSEGNPFFVGEYLRAVVREGFLSRDDDGQWRVTQDIHDLADSARLELPASMRGVVERRLAVLPEHAYRAAQFAAVLGRDCEVDLVAEAAGLDDAELIDAVSELVRRVVVEERGAGRIRFVHDKLRESLYGGLADKARQEAHQRVACAIEQRRPTDAAHIYELARQYGLGTGEAPQRVYETNRTAGERALADNAPGQAVRFLETAAAAAKTVGIALDAAFHGTWGDAYLGADRLDDAAPHFERGIELAGSTAQRSHLRTRLAVLHLSNFEAQKAWPEAEKALSDLGAPLSRSLGGALRSLWDWLRGMFGQLWQRPAVGEERERLSSLASTYQAALGAAYYNMDVAGWAFIVPRVLYPATRIVASRQRVEAITAYAIGVASMKLASLAERYGRWAIDVATSMQDPQAIGHARIWAALAMSMAGRSSAAVEAMRTALAEHAGWISVMDCINGSGDLAWNLAIRGYTREAWDAHLLVLNRMRRASSWKGIPEGHAVLSQRLFILPVLGREAEVTEYLAHARSLSQRYPDNRFHESFVHCNLTMLYHELGQYREPFEEAIRRYKASSPSPRLTFLHSRAFYVYQALGRLAQCRAARTPESLRRARAAVRELGQAANHDPLAAFWFVCRGALARLAGQPRRAHRHLERAAALAAKADSPWVAFKVAMERMRLAREQGAHAAVVEQGERALEFTRRHGWVHRERRTIAELERV